ncbi:MAG: lipopolysaccharide biosynthesis protein [Myxococcales bacterium]|nr:lipopolysaccharide biosynthesis protein [Myxococcales bacterium]
MSAPDAPLSTKVARGVAWAAGAQAIIAVADIVSMLFATMWVGTEEIGIAALAFPFYTMLDTAADLGVTSSLIQRDDHTPDRVSTVFWFNMLISSGLLGVLLVIGPLYARALGHPVVGWLLIVYGGKLIFQNVYAIPFALLRKELRFSEIAVARVIAHLAESASRVIYAMLGASVWVFTLAALTRAFTFGVIMQIRHPFIPKLVFRPREVVHYVTFGVRSAASQFLYQLYTNLDYPVVSHYFGDVANGVYWLAYYIVLEPVKTIANVVIDVAFPTFARLRNDRAQLIDQFIKFTRLNLIAVLPFVVLILLCIPEFLQIFYGGKDGWTVQHYEQCADAARILCIVGMLRALGFIGPPLLDGYGKPELTLRYMIIATLVVPASFVAGAKLLPQLGLLSVAVAWAVGYPLAFAVLMYLIVKTIDLPLGAYLKAAWGIIGSCIAGGLAGFGVSLALPHESAGVRLIAVGGTAIAVMLTLFATWQKITPKSIAKSLKG